MCQFSISRHKGALHKLDNLVLQRFFHNTTSRILLESCKRDAGFIKKAPVAICKNKCRFRKVKNKFHKLNTKNIKIMIK